jgi:hypothetical protein
MRKIKAVRGPVRDDYLELIYELPLRELRSDREQEAAIALRG